MPRFFDVPSRGEIRDGTILSTFRSGLRLLRDGAGNVRVPEATITRATQEGGRWYAEADGVELACLAIHAKAAGLADQIDPRRATTGTLRGLHAPLRELVPLPAAGATLVCEATATVGTLFVGSTTVPDSAAAYATDPTTGLKYQVLYSVTTPANGIAGSDPANPLYLVGVDTGERTNLPAGTKLRWAQAPLGAAQEFEVVEDGTGGTDAETDAELADRVAADIAHRPESGNNAHVRSWGRGVTTAVEDLFVYACAKYAGTMVAAVTQKRGRQKETAPKGPLARIPAAGTLARVRAYLVPPASPVVPERIVSYVVAPAAETVNMTVGLALPRGRGLGWKDVRPWPLYASGPASISNLTSQTVFKISSQSALPGGSTAPAIMAWNATTSRWVELLVTSITLSAPNTYDVVLTAAPSGITLAVGSYISPAVRQRAAVVLAQGVERYFDSLGPGEVVTLGTDLRASRAQRFPAPLERWPQRAGSAIVNALQSALPGTISTGEVLQQSATSPTVPADPVTGPSMLVAGKIAVYPSD